MADGGFRDAVKLLEELVLLAEDKKITKELFETSYKSANVYMHVADLLGALKKEDMKAGLEVVKTVVSQGVDAKYFIQQTTEELHRMLLNQLGVKGQESRVKDVSLTIDEIKVLVELMSKAFQETKFAVVPQLPLELAIIEWCTSEGTNETEEPNETKVNVRAQGVTVSSLRKQVGTLKKVQALYGTPKKVKEEGVEIKTTTVELEHTPGDGTITQEWLDVFWKSLIAEMKTHNHTAAGVLRSCTIKSYDKKTLVIATAYKFHKERLDDFKTKDALVKVCKMLTGKTIEVAIELKT
jgi:DNA polymerase III gamma/tau subunit